MKSIFLRIMPLLALIGYTGNTNAITPTTACAYTFGAFAGINTLKRFINVSDNKDGNKLTKCAKTVWFTSLLGFSATATATCAKLIENKNIVLDITEAAIKLDIKNTALAAAAIITATDILFQRYFTQDSFIKTDVKSSDTEATDTKTTKCSMSFFQKAETTIRAVPALLLAGYAVSKYLS